jgi:enoyl-CoA hydratase/carnithine racemase
MELEAHDSGIHIIWLPEEGENRLTLAFMDNYLRLFRRAENTASAIITASRSKKFWSNGVDLKANQTLDILRGLCELALVLLESKTPTIAFLNGHAFGGGFMFALAHDYRLSFEKKGFYCVPAIDLKIELPRPLILMARRKLPPASVNAVLLQGKRFGGTEAKKMQIVDDTVGGLEEVIEFGKLIGKGSDKQSVYKHMKAVMYEDVIAAFRGQIKARL